MHALLRMILPAVVMFAVSPAQADVLLKFKDGTANVWEGYSEKGNQYCTQKSIGEYCVLKKDVLSVQEVPPGTQASEYGVSSLGDKNVSKKREENVRSLSRFNCDELSKLNTPAARKAYAAECTSWGSRSTSEDEDEYRYQHASDDDDDYPSQPRKRRKK